MGTYYLPRKFIRNYYYLLLVERLLVLLQREVVDVAIRPCLGFRVWGLGFKV